MKFASVVIQEVASAKLLTFCVPDDIEIENLPLISAIPDYLPTTLLFEAWYTTLKQGIDWRAGYYNHNPTYQEPKGGTATYYFSVGGHRVNFATFDKARRELPDSFQRHLLDVAEKKTQLRLEVAYELWRNFIRLYGD